MLMIEVENFGKMVAIKVKMLWHCLEKFDVRFESL